jgi:hypothetical protein
MLRAWLPQSRIIHTRAAQALQTNFLCQVFTARCAAIPRAERWPVQASVAFFAAPGRNRNRSPMRGVSTGVDTRGNQTGIAGRRRR